MARMANIFNGGSLDEAWYTITTGKHKEKTYTFSCLQTYALSIQIDKEKAKERITQLRRLWNTPNQRCLIK